MAPITAARIEALLQPQCWESDNSWNEECKRLIDDMRAFECEPRFSASSLPDLTRWTGAARPDWKRSSLPSRAVLPADIEFVNPMFAWFSMSIWPKALDHNVSGLFYVLMRCGCGSAATLGATTSTGRVLLQFAAAATTPREDYDDADDPGGEDDYVTRKRTRALSLLMDQPNLPLFGTTVVDGKAGVDSIIDASTGPYCCALCTTMHNELDLVSIQVLSLLTPVQRLACLTAPHWAFARACEHRCTRTFGVLWKFVRDLMSQPDCNAAEFDRIISGPVSSDGYRRGVFATVALSDDEHAWQLITNAECPLAAALLRHTNAHTERQNANPLGRADVIRGVFAREEDDLHGAWLVPRLNADLLNAYDEKGYTPTMSAAFYVRPKTLAALMARSTELDLLAQQIPVWVANDFRVPADALARADTKFLDRTAISMLKGFILSSPIAELLRAETDAQKLAIPHILCAVIPALERSDGARFPRELVSLCAQYAGLSGPLANARTETETAFRLTLSVEGGGLAGQPAGAHSGAKHNLVSADVENSNANSVGSADASAGPSPKRQRLT